MPSLFFNQRLEIYLYLPLNTIFLTLSRLSRSEHLSLINFWRYQPDMLTGFAALLPPRHCPGRPCHGHLPPCTLCPPCWWGAFRVPPQPQLVHMACALSMCWWDCFRRCSIRDGWKRPEVPTEHGVAAWVGLINLFQHDHWVVWRRH